MGYLVSKRLLSALEITALKERFENRFRGPEMAHAEITIPVKVRTIRPALWALEILLKSGLVSEHTAVTLAKFCIWLKVPTRRWTNAEW